MKATLWAGREIKTLEDSHLMNAIRYIERKWWDEDRGGTEEVGDGYPAYPDLIEEATRRDFLAPDYEAKKHKTAGRP